MREREGEMLLVVCVSRWEIVVLCWVWVWQVLIGIILVIIIILIIIIIIIIIIVIIVIIVMCAPWCRAPWRGVPRTVKFFLERLFVHSDCSHTVYFTNCLHVQCVFLFYFWFVRNTASHWGENVCGVNPCVVCPVCVCVCVGVSASRGDNSKLCVVNAWNQCWKTYHMSQIQNKKQGTHTHTTYKCEYVFISTRVQIWCVL